MLPSRSFAFLCPPLRALASALATTLLALACCLFPPRAESAPAPLDADNLAEAFGMAATNMRHMDSMRALCSALMPDFKSQVHGIAMVWEQANQPERSAVQAYAVLAGNPFKVMMDTTSGIMLAAVHALPADKQRAYCVGFFGQARKGEQDFAARNPQASRYLRQYMAEHPLSAAQAEQLDFNTGCAKRTLERALAAKAGFDLDVTTSTCLCLWTATRNNTSAAERREQDEWARAGKPVGEMPHVRRIAPLLRQCVQANPR